MSDEAVRCLLFPEKSPGREVVVAVVDGKLVVPEEIGTETTQCLLPDGLMIVASLSLESARKPINRRIAGQDIRGPFLVTKCDSMCEPVSLSDKEIAFYISAAIAGDDTSTPVSLGDEREVMIADVVVVYRKVKIPATCKCGADLTRNDAIMLWSYSDEGVKARLPRFAGDEVGSVPQLGVLMSEAAACPRPGEDYIKNVAITCMGCSQVVVEGATYNEPGD